MPPLKTLPETTPEDRPRSEAPSGTPAAVAPVDLAARLATFDTPWHPRIVAGYNGNDVMVVKAEGAFVWHAHPETDDLFLVLSGRLDIELPEGTVSLGPGQLHVVPAGMRHRPVARPTAELLIIEPSGTPNTGDPRSAVHKPHA
ncbi:cupin domain-containing protein [Profundibacterium mesophilum]|uniref:3-hydroxyanthranilate 34-dioxygenase n=1 Tax=Profundibacterium mesophilum KAUST100406-0324 TaxID=1037889 RepID=A0A921NR19_9RHOB|nr:cupin domain-containing protein [Profundibacterium mesophilum]KAF0674554.1 3-hydroxyanthranilate 34-dioxygenase [Profundibacterium mesophilum KAUST100406-0324]